MKSAIVRVVVAMATAFLMFSGGSAAVQAGTSGDTSYHYACEGNVWMGYWVDNETGEILDSWVAGECVYECIDGLLYETILWSEPVAPQGGEPEVVGTCGGQASVRGTAFEDLNANGKWDAGEPKMGGAWFKVSDGGGWFVCGYAGSDSTYGVPVTEVGMTYFVYAIAPKGWRTTTPVVKATKVDTTNGFAYLNNNLGFVRDATVTTVEACDQYHPVRK
ncbi:MAG: hypothetical protein K1X39_05805 [Thermoflexales bacterium]|nr:hypothetical protein [Thermoflexales bacterium]